MYVSINKQFISFAILCRRPISALSGKFYKTLSDFKCLREQRNSVAGSIEPDPEYVAPERR